jgi:hypothetical protein
VDYEYADAFTGKVIASGNLPGTLIDGKYSHPFFNKPSDPGVYNLKISAYDKDKLLDIRFHETVVVGKISQQEALLKDMESMTKLELVDEIYCGDAKEKHPFIDGASTENNSGIRNAIVNTSSIEGIGDKLFRSLGRSHGDWLSYRFTVKNKYLPHIIDIEFMDDRDGVLISRVTETARKTYQNTGDTKMMRCSASVAAGGAFKPPTGKIQNLKLFYIPSYADATIDLINGSHYNNPGISVYRIRVYELKEMPALKVPYPSGRLFGMMQERYPIALRAFYGGDAAESFVGVSWGQFQHKHFGFYKKHYQSVVNQIRWMRFCGENLWFPSVWMYAGPFYPTNVMRHAADSPKDDYMELMLRMFGKNDVYMMPLFEFTPYGGGQVFPFKPVTNTEVALGAATNKIVTKEGLQTVASNICHPEVQKRYREIVRDFMDRYGSYPALLGIGLYAGPARYCLEPMVTEFDFKSNDPEVAFEGSYDDVTMEQFEKFLGRKIPVDVKDMERFGKRYEWIKKNARKEFTDFRCRKLAELHKIIRDEVISKNQGKEYWPVHFVPVPIIIEAMRKKGIGVREIYRHFGIDPELYKKQGNMLASIQKGTPTWQYEGMNDRISETVANFWQESDDFHQAWDNGDSTLFLLRNGFDEIMTTVPENKEWFWGPWNGSKVDPSLNEAHRYFARYMTNCLLKTTPKVIVSGGLQDELLSVLGHYDRQWHFTAPFRSIPLGAYRTLKGAGLDKNIAVRLSEKDGKYNFYVANPYWWDVNVSVTLSKDGEIRDLVEDSRSNGTVLKFQLNGYGVKVFSASGIPVSAEATVSNEGVEYMKAQLAFFDCLGQVTDADLKLLRFSQSRVAINEAISKAKTLSQSGDCVAAINILNHPELVELRKFCRERSKVKAAPQEIYRVNCGSFEKYTDSSGNIWLPDQAFRNGIENYGYMEPAGSTIDRAASGRKFSFPDYRIYTTERYGIKGYLFRVPNGNYTVRIHTMEGYKPDNGVYDPAIFINGQQKIKSYYIFAEVGFDKPLIKEVKGINVTDGIIRIEFETATGGSRVCGIEVIREK